MKKRKLSLRAADGVILPTAARPVSPFSLRGMGSALGGAYQGAVDATSRGMDAVHAANPWVNHVPAVTPMPAPAAPMAPAPVAAPTDGMPTVGGAVNAIQAHQQLLQNLRDGSPFVTGHGGPIDDKVPAKLSPGEAVLPADTTAALGKENIAHLIDQTHTPAHLQKQGVPPGGPHMAARRGLRFADGIPGLDVSESPFTESDARTFGTRPAGTVPGTAQIPGIDVTTGGGSGNGVVDPGPGNPNVGNRVGPIRPSVTPAVPAAAAEEAPLAARAATGIRGFLSGGGGDVVGAIRSVAGGVAPFAKAALRGNAIIAPAIATATGLNTDTEEYAKRFGMEDTQPGVLRDLGLRTLGVASDIGDAMTWGQAGKYLFRDKQDQPATPAVPAAQPAPAPAGQVVQGAPGASAPTATTAPPLDNSVLPGGAQAGKIQRRGNSFTNTGSYINDERSGSISPQNDAAMSALADRYAPGGGGGGGGGGLRGGYNAPGDFSGPTTNWRGALTSGDSNLPAGYGALVPGVNAPASQYQQELDTRNASVKSDFADRGLNANQRQQGDIERARMAQTGQLAGQRDATERRGQDVSADVARGGQRVSMRGQDLSYDSSMYGHQITGASARARLGYEMKKDNRDFNQRVTEHNDALTKQDFEVRQQAEKGVHEQITNMLPPGPDGKPDEATAARYATGLNAIVAQHQQALQQSAARGDKGAAAALDDLNRHGVGALDQGTIRNFVNGMKAKDLSDQYASSRINPVGGTGTISDTPAAGIRKTSNGVFGLGGEYSLLDAAGRPTGATIPARAVEGDGSFIGGKRRTDLRDFVR